MRTWCSNQLGIRPGDLALYRQAVRHVSASPEGRPDLPDNERLEFLGDAVLDAVVGEFLFSTYPSKGEGFLTRMRSKLVSREQLNLLAKHVDILQVLESNMGRHHETSVPGNALEALIGAIFLDKGFDRTRQVVVKLLTTHFDLRDVEQEDRDSKSRLLEWAQKNRRRVEFRFVEEHAQKGRGRTHTAEAVVDGRPYGKGLGKSKKQAEQDAAQQALEVLQGGAAQRPARKVNSKQGAEERTGQDDTLRRRRRGGRGRRPQPPPTSASPPPSADPAPPSPAA
jgi:ribonuclease III